MQHIPSRESARRTFAVSALGENVAIAPLGGDASFRRYFRCSQDGESYILMDSPPEYGGVMLFSERTAQFSACGLPVPQIKAADNAQGFLLLQDFGDRWLWQDLREHPEGAMTQALALLGIWQQATQALKADIQPYSHERLGTEVALLREWFLPWLGIQVDNALLAQIEMQIVMLAGQGPRVCVHRDYHSRNLMRCTDGNIGILDYQDALWGNAAYDLVSITRDCYIRYPIEDVHRWEEAFRAQYYADVGVTEWADLCHAVSLQRHMKVLGLFVRLAERDGKHRYLVDLPRVFSYVQLEAAALPVLSALSQLLQDISPVFKEKLA
ncbi:MAG: phosphotransferase [Cardiobacteriaceae bacterium]|nr:phosphotransferase [Cardiobacteriaceae bacterium]